MLHNEVTHLSQSICFGKLCDQKSAIGSLWSHATSPKHILVGILKGEMARKSNSSKNKKGKREETRPGGMGWEITKAE
jgi:hypothetical protein